MPREPEAAAGQRGGRPPAPGRAQPPAEGGRARAGGEGGAAEARLPDQHPEPERGDRQRAPEAGPEPPHQPGLCRQLLQLQRGRQARCQLILVILITLNNKWLVDILCKI